MTPNRLLLTLTSLGVLLAQTLAAPAALAITNTDRQHVVDDTVYYDPKDELCSDGTGRGTFSGGTSGPVTAIQGMDSYAVDRINALLPTYMAASNQTGVPWQYLAAIDYRENNNNPDASMLGGEPLGTKATDSNNTPQTKLESILIGISILKAKEPIYGVDPTKSNLTVDQLKQMFVTYNRGTLYKAAGVDPDKSPYVMNNYDETHTNMMWPNNAAEPPAMRGLVEYGRLGAFTVLSRLPGGETIAGQGGSSNCNQFNVIPGEVCKIQGGTTLNPVDCAAYWAKKILEAGSDKFDLTHSVPDDLQAAVAKVPIHNSDTCGRDTYLHPWLLYALYRTAVEGHFKITIWNIVTQHGCDQYLHPYGRATDLGAINDVSTSTDDGYGQNNRSFTEFIAQILPRGGEVLQAKKCYAVNEALLNEHGIVYNWDTCNHIHVSVGYDTP